MIKLKQFEFERLGDYTWKYDIYKGEEGGVCLSVFIYKWTANYDVQIVGRGICQFIPGECQFNTFEEAENAAKEFIKKILLQHIEME